MTLRPSAPSRAAPRAVLLRFPRFRDPSTPSAIVASSNQKTHTRPRRGGVGGRSDQEARAKQPDAPPWPMTDLRPVRWRLERKWKTRWRSRRVASGCAEPSRERRSPRLSGAGTKTPTREARRPHQPARADIARAASDIAQAKNDSLKGGGNSDMILAGGKPGPVGLHRLHMLHAAGSVRLRDPFR